MEIPHSPSHLALPPIPPPPLPLTLPPSHALPPSLNHPLVQEKETEQGALDEVTIAHIAAAETLLKELKPKAKDLMRFRVLEVVWCCVVLLSAVLCCVVLCCVLYCVAFCRTAV